MNKWRKDRLWIIAMEIEGIKTAVENVIAEETATVEKMLPRARHGERGRRAEAAIGNMEAAADLLARARAELKKITEMQDEEGARL